MGTVLAEGHRPELAVEVEKGNIIPVLFRRLSLPELLTNYMWKEEVVLGGGRVGLPGLHSSVMPLSLIGNLGGKAGGVGAGHDRPDVEELTNKPTGDSWFIHPYLCLSARLQQADCKIRQRVKRGQSPPELEA